MTSIFSYISAAGLFTGSFVALFCVYAFLANIYGTLTSKHETDYVETVYPIFR